MGDVRGRVANMLQKRSELLGVLAAPRLFEHVDAHNSIFCVGVDKGNLPIVIFDQTLCCHCESLGIEILSFVEINFAVS